MDEPLDSTISVPTAPIVELSTSTTTAMSSAVLPLYSAIRTGFCAARGPCATCIRSIPPIVHVSGIANDGQMVGTIVAGTAVSSHPDWMLRRTVFRNSVSPNQWGVDIAALVSHRSNSRWTRAGVGISFLAFSQAQWIQQSVARSRRCANQQLGWSSAGRSRARRQLVAGVSRATRSMEDLGSVCCLNAGASAMVTPDDCRLVGRRRRVRLPNGDGMISWTAPCPASASVVGYAINHARQSGAIHEG